MSFESNFALGICTVTYGGVNLGKTKGFVDVTIRSKILENTGVIPYGDTPVEHYDIGTEIQVIVPLVEFTLSNLNIAIPKSVLGSDRITVGGWPGDDNVLSARKLILTPIDNDPNADLPVVIYKSVVKNMRPLIWDYNVKILELTFAGQIDTNRGAGDQLFRIGGPAS